MKKSETPTLAQISYILVDRDNCLTLELKATVCQNRPYIDSLEVGAPDTPRGYNARKVGDQYPPVFDQEVEVGLVLRNYPKGDGSWGKALAWAKSKGYKNANPYELFAVTEQYDLCKHLERNWLRLIATTDCPFEDFRQAVCVLVGKKSYRSAFLYKLGFFSNDSDWFIFRT